MARDLSLYIHIPYCTVRCGYCDFNTYTPQELKSENTLAEITNHYISTLILELKQVRKNVGEGVKVPTIFIGGGTPSLVSAKEYQRLFKIIRENFEVTPDCEITIESNPDSLTAENLAGYREAGINRISLGMQSAVPSVLKVLNRTHNPDNIEKAVHNAGVAGYDEINLDLIYGTPGESLAQWQQSLDLATSLNITHLSAYALIVEEGTKLAREIANNEVGMPDDDLSADKYLLADKYLSQKGFSWYELSNWAKPGSECKHNLIYWQSGEWWGLGPGAFSYYDRHRFWNVKNPNTYKQLITNFKFPIEGREVLNEANLLFESIMLGTRLASGIEIKSMPEIVANRIENLNPLYYQKDEMDSGKLVLTAAGRLMADAIVRDLTQDL